MNLFQDPTGQVNALISMWRLSVWGAETSSA
jgi:hypothetical protein